MKGTINQVKPGVWRLRVYVGRKPNGQPIQASKTVRGGKRDAEDELRRFIGQVEKSRTPERSATLARLLEEWLEHKARSATPYTMQNYQYVVNTRIVPKLGKVRLDRLTPKMLDRAYAQWQDEGLSPATVRKTHNVIGAALRQAARWGWVDEPATARTSPPSGEIQPIARSIREAELEKLVKAAWPTNPTLALAVSLGAVTGARRGELCALRWSDVTDRTLTISRSLTVLHGGKTLITQPKTRKIRRLALEERSVALLDHWRAYQKDLAERVGVPLDPDPYIVTAEPRGHIPLLPNTLTHQFRRLARSQGFPYHFHELRHFAATTMIAGGIDPRMAATRLGHTDPRLTLNVYAHAVEAADRRAAELLGSMLPALPERAQDDG